MSSTPVVQIAGLAKSYGRTPAVRDVSFEVAEGEIFGILGPNGAGKTTTVEILLGLRTHDAGTVRVLGVDPKHDRDTIRRHVGAQLQHARLADRITVREALQLFASFYDDPADWRELSQVLGLDDVHRTVFRNLSGGQQQRLSVALALVGNPRIAVLDELTTGLDPAARRETWQFLERVRDRGVTIVLVTHFMQEAEYLCDRLAVIDGGRVVALDTPAGIVETYGTGTQRLRFTPSRDLAIDLLTDLPEVHAVDRHGEQLVVDGDAEVLGAVTAVLARHGIVASGLRVRQQSLDDAFLSITRRDTEADA